MIKKESTTKVILLLLSVLTIISLVYLKIVYIKTPDQTAYFPFYKSMTYLEYAETTKPGFFEFVAFICIYIAYVFLSFSHWSENTKHTLLYVGIFQSALIAILCINLITFQIVNRDIRVIPGITLLLLILSTALTIYVGTSKTKQPVTPIKQSYEGREEITPSADILREKREEAQFTQQQLADAVLVSRQTVHRWESGKTYPDLEYMIRVAQALDFPVTEFWDDNSEQMNDELAGGLRKGKIYKKAAYFLLSLIIVVLAVISVAYIGKNAQSPYLDRINPFIKEEIGYVLVQKSGRQKVAAIDNEFGAGSVVTINGSYTGKDEFVKVVHKGAYLESEYRNISKSSVPKPIISNLYYISHFDTPTNGLQKLQLSYHKRDI
ncbi:helix-turn-helix domain-containing protein [Companilactobacillus ginsenosidimutans]|uniref:helix-turn-helix domain-containing protein n=1 Tax=Companilactobacillus ginsenosidimutans TaxID=1007676 RepID=UPI00065FE6C8|nr:helix-turn-helix domain-containing protein [Companilactobacillus ginsenosidimutans]